MDNPPIVFIHIAKTAGTSLRGLLRTRVAGSAVLEIPQGTRRRSRLFAHVDDFELVVGHINYAVTELFHRPPAVITFLREPIDRAMSAYYFVRQMDDSNIPPTLTRSQRRARVDLIRQMKALSLREFIHAHPASARTHLGNIQTANLGSQNFRRKRRRPVGIDDLERAKENLQRCVSFGLTERVDESMALICESLGWAPFDGFPHSNSTRNRPSTDDLDGATLDELRELTALDAELYRFASELFERRWQALLASRPTTAAAAVGARDAHTFCFDRRIPGSGWYGSERMGDAWFSWTGPDTESSIDLQPPPCDHLLLRVSVAHALHPDALHETQLFVNGAALTTVVRSEGNIHHLEAAVPTAAVQTPGDVARITIRTPFVLKPCDVDPDNGDTRALGLAVTSVALLPASRLETVR